LRSKLQKFKSRIICSCPTPAQLKCNDIYVSYVTIFVSSLLKTEGLQWNLLQWNLLQWNLFVNCTWPFLLAVSRYFMLQQFYQPF